MSKFFATLCLLTAVAFTASAQNQRLFQNYKEMVGVDVRLTDIGMYYPRGEDDTATTHPYPATAIAFDYADEHYYILNVE